MFKLCSFTKQYFDWHDKKYSKEEESRRWTEEQKKAFFEELGPPPKDSVDFRGVFTSLEYAFSLLRREPWNLCNQKYDYIVIEEIPVNEVDFILNKEIHWFRAAGEGRDLVWEKIPVPESFKAIKGF